MFSIDQKSLAYTIDKKGDYVNVNDELKIPLSNAADYINKVNYLLCATNLDFTETANILNFKMEDENKLEESELRSIYNNKNKSDNIMGRNEMN
jgi:hypothetical protein